MGRRPDRERGVSAAWLSCAKRCCIIVMFRLSWGEGLFCYAVHYCTVCKLIMTQSGMDHAHVLSPDLFLYEESLKRVVSFNQSLFSFSFPFFFSFLFFFFFFITVFRLSLSLSMGRRENEQ